MVENFKQTLIRIEPNKKELATKMAQMKGISLNKFINDAIDVALSIETKEKIQLSKEKEISIAKQCI